MLPEQDKVPRHVGTLMNDPIDTLLQSFALSTRIYFAGNLCEIENFDAAEGVAHIHVLRSGQMDVVPAMGDKIEMREPSLLFFPRPTHHRLLPVEPEGADLICTSIEFGQGTGHPLVQALPPVLVVPFSSAPGMKGILDVFVVEAFDARHGQSAALRRIAEVVLIFTVRHAFERGLLQPGLMSALADPRLSKALLALHGEPATHWPLELMAEKAGMSRARFAASFQQVVGIPPGEYLAHLRISIAQSMLLKGRAVKQIADLVGYGSSTALTRAFTAHVGLSPTAWLTAQSQPLKVSQRT